MSPNQALWEKGDFTRIAESMRKSGEALISQLGITKNHVVLDLGCGDGTTAIPSARTGAKVFGVDIARNLVEAGKKRALGEGLSNITFQHGDACDLNQLPDNSFDVVVSIFGAMFAPKPFEVAREMVRVAKRGGKIVMGNWIPGDPTMVSQVLRITSAYMPPPPDGFVSPMQWGIASQVIERFGAAGIPSQNISFFRDTYVFDYAGTPEAFVQEFRNYYGPTMNAFDSAEKAGRADDLQLELENLLKAQNTSPTPDRTLVPATFMRVTVNVPL